MRTGVFIGSLAFAAGAAAQVFPGQEPKSMAPARSGAEAPTTVRQPTPDRNQFSPGAMRIQIEGAGRSGLGDVASLSASAPSATSLPFTRSTISGTARRYVSSSGAPLWNL